MVIWSKVIPVIDKRRGLQEERKHIPGGRNWAELSALCHLRVRRAALHWRDCSTGNSISTQRSFCTQRVFSLWEDAEPPSAACCQQDDLRFWVAKDTFFFSLYIQPFLVKLVYFYKKIFFVIVILSFWNQEGFLLESNNVSLFLLSNVGFLGSAFWS